MHARSLPLVAADVPTSVPGAGTRRFVATRDEGRSYAMIYAPVGRTLAVRLEAFNGPMLRGWWFNPRTGQATPIGEFPAAGRREFSSPDVGEAIDWVLVLDEAAKNYPPPGQVRPNAP